MIEKGNDNPKYESEIIESEEEIIEYSNKGYSCEQIDEGKWLMRKEAPKSLSKRRTNLSIE